MPRTDGGSARARRVGTAAASAAAVAVLAAAALLFVLKPLSLTMPDGGRDGSWITVLGEAATLPARWGVDLAFTYGPGSALVTRYFTPGYLLAAVPALVALASAYGACFVLLVRRASAGRRHGAALAVAAVSAAVAALASQLALDQDGFVFAFVLALMLLDLARRPGERAAAGAVVVGAALLGASALAKTSYGVAALGVFALADLRAAAAWRRVPTLVPTALLGALAAFLSLGQRLGDLPAYLSLQGQAASGYGEAMYLAPMRGELGGFLCASAALVAVAALCGPARAGGRVAAALGTAFLLAIGLKAGFVRADGHTQIAWSLLGLAGIAVAAGPALARSAAWAAALGAASLAALWFVAPLFFLADTGRPVSAASLGALYGEMGEQGADRLQTAARFLHGPAAFAREAAADKAQAWTGVRGAQPLPQLPGTVDILPSEQGAVLAAGLDYRPRPSFQEYGTYTAGLIAADRAFLHGPRAPDWVIFGMGGLDDRYPAMTEGALWPDLLALYEPQRRAGPWVALHRRAVPLAGVLGAPSHVEARLGEPVAMPVKGPVFADITVRRTLLGRIAALLFRPPALTLEVSPAGGERQSYRFIPAIAAEGFLLSPLLTDADGFADLAFGHGEEAGGADIQAFAVGGSRWARLFYESAVSVTLRPLAVPEAPPSPAAAALVEDLDRALPWRRLVQELGRGGQLDADRLNVPPPATLSPIPVPAGRRLRLGFGIADGAWTEGATEGVCFALTSASGAAAPLWRRCLDPKADAADRGPQSAVVEIPPGLDAVKAETTCPRSCAWGWSYWNDIAPAP